MEVPIDPICGTYDELVDMAEDIENILGAVEANTLDLTPGLRAWLAAQVERVDRVLAVDVVEGWAL